MGFLDRGVLSTFAGDPRRLVFDVVSTWAAHTKARWGHSDRYQRYGLDIILLL